MFKKPQPEDDIKRIIKRIVDASTQVLADTAVLLIYNMTAVKDFSPGLTSLAKMKTNQPVLFMYQPKSQPSADYLQSKLGDKLRLEKFEGDGHAPFVDNHEKFNHVLKDLMLTSWSSHLRGPEPCFLDSEKHCSQAPWRCTSCCWLSTTRSTMGPISNLSNMS